MLQKLSNITEIGSRPAWTVYMRRPITHRYRDCDIQLHTKLQMYITIAPPADKFTHTLT